MPTITADISAESTTPVLIMPWRTLSASSNVFHDIQDAEMPWVSLRAARGHRGELRLFYNTSETDAAAAAALLRTADTFTIDYDERTSLEMTFAVEGDVEVELNEETQDHWVVRFGYRQVA